MLNWIKSNIFRSRIEEQTAQPEIDWREVELAYGLQVSVMRGHDCFHIFTRLLSSSTVYFQTVDSIDKGQKLQLILPCGADFRKFAGEVLWVEKKGRNIWGAVALEQTEDSTRLQHNLLNLEAVQRERAS